MNLINFFDNCRFWGNKRNSFLQRIRFYGIINYLIDIIANLVLPIYFKLTQNNLKYTIIKNDKIRKNRFIVSFTSFPTRINKVWLVVETILRQTYKPDMILLYLSKEQFPNYESIPKNLKEQVSRGLKIILCDEDLRSHKKYYYAIQDYPNDNIITVDDDIFYRTDLIESLVISHKQRPDIIIANWGKRILPNKNLYKEWPDAQPGDESIYILPIGVGAVLYPPHSLYADVIQKEIFIQNCFKADDVWLSCMSILNNTPKYINAYKCSYLPIVIKNNVTLLDTNKSQNQTQIESLNKYYNKKMGIKPFFNTGE